MSPPALTCQQIHAIAFDLDGTLVDSLVDLAAAANAMRTQLGMTALDAKAVEHYVGDGVAVLVHRALCNARDGRADEALWQQGLVAFVQYYRAHLTVHTRAYAGMETALKLFKKHDLPLAVVTNKNEVLAVELLQQLGLLDYFSLVIGGDTLPEKKPSARPLQHCAHVLGVAAANLLMVGDSANDIQAAKAAGCLSVGVRWGYADMDVLWQNPATRADWVFSKPTDIYDHLWQPTLLHPDADSLQS